MTVEEIKVVLEINGKEVNIFLPNEIFEDLQDNLTDSSHIAYAYSYIYLVHFLYRNCKYFNTKELIDNNVIKQILGYSDSNRTMNYITKKGGLLEDIGYLESTKDFPLAWNFKDGSGEGLSFDMSSEIDKDTLPPIPKMFFLKRPLKAFERERQLIGETTQIEYRQGTFYDVSNSHTVPFKVFMYCMANEDLGVIGFYLYSWLKLKNDIFSGYDVSLLNLASETGISIRTLVKYLNFLKGYNLIKYKFNQDYFVIGMYVNERKATTYYTNKFNSFLEKPIAFNKMTIMKRKDYFALKKNEKEKERKEFELLNPKLEMDIDSLPF